MASTTKTTNLELSQFVGTDKPAWLTDYNGDMQKIDNGYKKLEDANTATQADLDATKQDLSGSKTDIADVKADIQALEAQDIAIGNRLTVVEGNYDTMHHEVAINQQNIDDIKTDLGIDTPLTTTATTVHGAINEMNSISNVELTISSNVTDYYANDPILKSKAFKCGKIVIISFMLTVNELTADPTSTWILLGNYNINLHPVRATAINTTQKREAIVRVESGMFLASPVYIAAGDTIQGEIVAVVRE